MSYLLFTDHTELARINATPCGTCDQLFSIYQNVAGDNFAVRDSPKFRQVIAKHVTVEAEADWITTAPSVEDLPAEFDHPTPDGYVLRPDDRSLKTTDPV